jgi:hypothetical protein
MYVNYLKEYLEEHYNGSVLFVMYSQVAFFYVDFSWNKLESISQSISGGY